MTWQLNPYALFTATATIVGLVLVVLSWRRRRETGGWWLVVLLGIVTWYLATYTMELLSSSLSGIFLWVCLEYLAIVLTVPFWLLFMLRYSSLGRFASSYQSLLFILPAVSLFMVWTNDWHHLFYRQIIPLSEGGLVLFSASYGPWFWVQSAYSLLLFFLGFCLCLYSLSHHAGLYRRQMTWMILGTFLPLAMYLITVSHLIPVPGLDLTPFGFLLAGLITFWALYRHHLIDLAPLARAAVMEKMEDAVLVFDPEYRLVDANAAAGRLMDIERLRSLGQPLEMVLKRWPELVGQFRQSAEASAEIVLGEGFQSQTLDLRTSLMRGQDGQTLCRLLVARDVTDRKRAEEAQRYGYERLSQILNNMNELVYIWDMDNYDILFTNRALQRAFGENQTQGKCYSTSKGRNTPCSPCSNDLLRQLNGQPRDSEMRSPITGRQYHLSEYMIRWPDGRDVRMGIASDVTESKREEELRADMTRAVAHDLSNPIEAIQAALELEPMADSPQKADEYRQMLWRNVSRLSMLVRNLLTAARIEAGELKLEKEGVELKELILGLVDAQKPLLTVKRLSCCLELPEQPIWLQGDRIRLEEAFANLFSNAIKFMTRGGSLGVHLFQCGAEAVVDISDTGPGIDSQELPQIFDRFYRGAGKSSGSGLGLFTVRWVVQQHGGEIAVKSTSEKGTTFTVRLPLGEPAIAVQENMGSGLYS